MSARHCKRGCGLWLSVCGCELRKGSMSDGKEKTIEGTTDAIVDLATELQTAMIGKPILICLGAGLSVACSAGKELKMPKASVMALLSAMWDGVKE